MADSKHSIPSPTPGPWRQQASASLLVLADTPDGERLIAGCWGHTEALLAEGIANARLIAAAPALRDALLELSNGENCWCPWRNGYHTRRCEQARAAIAAASPPDAQAEGAP